MNKLNTKGFGIVEVLLIVVLVGLIVGVGYYVYGSQKKTNSSLDNATKSQAEPQKTTALQGKVVFSKANEPEGWTESHLEGSKIYSLESEKLGCYSGIEIFDPKMDLNNVQPPADAPNREVTLGSGQKVKIYDSGQIKIYFVSEGFMFERAFNARVTVACQDKANYPAADAALKGIKLE